MQGVQPAAQGPAARCSRRAAAGGSSGHLVLPAGNASLQIYDPLTDRHVAHIQVHAPPF